jgi:hypothetical protein
MTLPIAVALPGDPREGAVVAALAHPAVDVTVVRRCVEVADVLAVCEAGVAAGVVLGGALLRLDRALVARMREAGAVVVGVPDDLVDAQRLERLGCSVVVEPGSGPGDVVTAVVRAVSADARAAASAPAGAGSVAPGVPGPAVDAGCEPRGRLTAVWGPTGAPGRTSIAVALAEALAAGGATVRLVDADPYGPCIDQVLGLVDDALPGLPAAARLAAQGRLDAAAVLPLLRAVDQRMSVLTGLPRHDRWHEVRDAVVPVVADALLAGADVVVDTGFCLEHDEELSFDTLAPRRNGATTAFLGAADRAVAVAAADPVGVRRLLQALPDAMAAAPEAAWCVALNRVRGPGQAAEVEGLLAAAGTALPVIPVRLDDRWHARWRRDGGMVREQAGRSAFVDDVVVLARSVVGPSALLDRRRFARGLRRTG